MTMREKIPTLSDSRLRALTFNMWRIKTGGNEERRKKANRLAPLVKAELDLRKRRKANPDARAVKPGAGA